jgi:pimeloyl-ACP methyl ester carboxylesterase
MTARWRVVLVLAVAVAVVFASRAMLSGLVRSALYPAPSVRVPSPPPPPLEELALELDGAPLSAWWLPASSPSAPVVLMLHGNGENLETLRRGGLFENFAELGVALVALDYPGYGRSAGKPSETALARATQSAWRALVARAGDERPRVVAGWSLGAAAAAQLAAAEPESVDALILLSPWTRLSDIAAVHFPGWLTGPLLADRYDTLAAAREIRCPALVVHGAQDDLIPAEHGRRVFAALPEPKVWLEVESAGHNDLLGRDETWRALAAALAAARRRGADAPSPDDLAGRGRGARESRPTACRDSLWPSPCARFRLRRAAP